MHSELLSTVAQALALLLHPSLHTYPHTLPQRRCAFRAHRRNLQLLLVFRAQVGYEATAPIVVVDNAIPMLKIRRAAASFAVLDVPSVCVVESVCPLLAFARVRAPRREGRLSRPVRVMDWSCARG